ncbi:uncharacterized protein METZ01_LOCUS489009 [marine metagenome]|uniref:Uncharacterized protein n=1 Tax=marine metagenome TaxID=408172 RepID=A0A383CW71_9ZZZZ
MAIGTTKTQGIFYLPNNVDSHSHFTEICNRIVHTSNPLYILFIIFRLN